jgi:hypothetical protein
MLVYECHEVMLSEFVSGPMGDETGDFAWRGGERDGLLPIGRDRKEGMLFLD